MSASYWIAKYVEDPFRNEPRNIGVIVSLDGILDARFLGERDDGTVDARKLRGFTYPAVYSQWREFWRRKIRARDLNAITDGDTANFYVAFGGEVDRRWSTAIPQARWKARDGAAPEALVFMDPGLRFAAPG